MANDLTLAFNKIKEKSIVYDKLFRYYEGDQPTVYLTDRLRDIFKGVNEIFTENWCSVVVDSMLDRIKLNGITIEDQTLANLMEDVFDQNQIMLEADDAHEQACVTGEAYIIAWKEDADAAVEIYLNDPRWVHIFYDPAHPRVPRFAVKVWVAEDETARVTLYYPDRLEYYIAKKRWGEISSARAFQPDPDQYQNETWPANIYEEVPVFQFKTKRMPTSELYNAIPIQNGVNKLLSDMMVAAEYGAFRQRYVISDAEVQGKLDSTPGGIWDLPGAAEGGQATSVGEFSATDLDNYLGAISQLATSIGIITRTPRHYFFNQGGDPSGEALIAMEAPLNKKVQDRIDRFKPTWEKLTVFIAKLMGYVLDQATIEIDYSKPESIQPKTQADITKVRVETGVPLEIALRWEGRPQSEIDEINTLVKKSKAEASQNLANSLLAAEKARNNETNQQDNSTNPADQNQGA